MFVISTSKQHGTIIITMSETNRRNILHSNKFKCLVSSVLNKDTKQHGKMFMFDTEDDTSWSSDQGKPQLINIQFDEPQDVESFCFQFQGGFVGKDSNVCAQDVDGKILHDESFYPDDINSKQHFKLKNCIKNCSKIKFTFNSSTDFFGRIIVYSLEIF